MEISKETKQEAVLYSLRGRIISFIGIIFTIMICLLFLFDIIEIVHRTTYTPETVQAISLIGGMICSIFSVTFFVLIFIKEEILFIINPYWFIKEPTEKELKYFFSKREKEIQTYLEEKIDLEKEKQKLKKEKAYFFMERMTKANTDLN